MTDAEMIEALATKVMGWTTCAHGCHWDDHSKKRALDMPVRGDLHGMPGVKWNPLVDPADSKQVRMKLVELFPNSVWSLSWLPRHKKFCFVLSHPENDLPNGYAEADTEERAVALCALKTVGVNVE